jgi:hypothetical protein
MKLHKDEALDRLAESGNVAQFIAYRPCDRGLLRSTSRIAGFPPNKAPEDVREAAATLLAASGERAVNVRSYIPDDPRSREFVYGIRSAEEAVGHLERLGAEGLHLILNETVDINDGGVSGVAQGDVIEFAPDDTPRAVEKPGTASIDRDLGLRLLETVYGFAPELPRGRDARVEFSIHPLPRGWRKTHTLLWEIEDNAGHRSPGTLLWPNRFSQHLGDKAFGLLVADALGFDVPKTIVIGRRVAPFAFGTPTDDTTVWMRTAPREPEPGYFTTLKGWRDPFALLAAEDPDKKLASILAQAAVSARFSGAAIMGAGSKLIIEGKAGEGDTLMLGKASPELLPPKIVTDVEHIYLRLSAELGPVRIEWVHDGVKVWIVQLHVGATGTSATTIVEGDAETWLPFDVSAGLGSLRDFLAHAPEGSGIELDGRVGLTSHIADLLRRVGRPTRVRAIKLVD